MLGKLKKHYNTLYKHREVMSKHNGSLPELNQLNGNELKIVANYYYREKDDSMPFVNDHLIHRINNAKHRNALTIDECLRMISVDDEKTSRHRNLSK